MHRASLGPLYSPSLPDTPLSSIKPAITNNTLTDLIHLVYLTIVLNVQIHVHTSVYSKLMHTTSNRSSLLLISRCLSFTWGSPCKLAFIELYYYLRTSQVGLICIHQVFGIRTLPTATEQHQAHQFRSDARTLFQIYLFDYCVH